ncbi:MAG: hypothetical protein WBQ05_16805, partial [Candidatus Competibacter denitrificans]
MANVIAGIDGFSCSDAVAGSLSGNGVRLSISWGAVSLALRGKLLTPKSISLSRLLTELGSGAATAGAGGASAATIAGSR